MICNDINGPKGIPEGTYDIGDGFYDPTKRIICKYDGEFKRDLDAGEEEAGGGEGVGVAVAVDRPRTSPSFGK